MSIIDQNDLILLCENQFWVRARVIVDTELIRLLAFDIHFLRLFDNKPEICLHQKILNASNKKTITSWYKNYSPKKFGTRCYQEGVQKDPPGRVNNHELQNPKVSISYSSELKGRSKYSVK